MWCDFFNDEFDGLHAPTDNTSSLQSVANIAMLQLAQGAAAYDFVTFFATRVFSWASIIL